MILIDTGYLIAIADTRDHLHRRAVAWAEVIREIAVVTEYVVLETVNFFSRIEDRPRVHALIAEIRSDPDCRVVWGTSQLFESGLKLHASRLDKDWSLTDCISFDVMRELKIQRALTYDLHFEQAGFEALLRRDPS